MADGAPSRNLRLFGTAFFLCLFVFIIVKKHGAKLVHAHNGFVRKLAGAGDATLSPRECFALGYGGMEIPFVERKEKNECWRPNAAKRFELQPCDGKAVDLSQYDVIVDFSNYNCFEQNVFHFMADNITPMWSLIDAEYECFSQVKSRVAFFLAQSCQYSGGFQAFILRQLENAGYKFIRGSPEMRLTGSFSWLDGTKLRNRYRFYDTNVPTPDEMRAFSRWTRLVQKSSVSPLPSSPTNVPSMTLVQRSTRSFVFKVDVERSAFKVVDFAALSPRDQIKTAFQSDVLVGAHGAGLMNAMWMRPGSVMVEVMPWYLCNWFGFVEFVRIAALSGVHVQKYCVSKRQTATKKEIPDNYSEGNRQGLLYDLKSMTLTQNDFEQLYYQAHFAWGNNKNLKSL